MKYWEYHTELSAFAPLRKEVLDELGTHGWELVSVVLQDDRVMFSNIIMCSNEKNKKKGNSNGA